MLTFSHLDICFDKIPDNMTYIPGVCWLSHLERNATTPRVFQELSWPKYESKALRNMNSANNQ